MISKLLLLCAFVLHDAGFFNGQLIQIEKCKDQTNTDVVGDLLMKMRDLHAEFAQLRQETVVTTNNQLQLERELKKTNARLVEVENDRDEMAEKQKQLENGLNVRLAENNINTESELTFVLYHFLIRSFYCLRVGGSIRSGTRVICEVEVPRHVETQKVRRHDKFRNKWLVGCFEN